jgi:hypothetical protein
MGPSVNVAAVSDRRTFDFGQYPAFLGGMRVALIGCPAVRLLLWCNRSGKASTNIPLPVELAFNVRRPDLDSVIRTR